MVEKINLEWLKTFRAYVESETLDEVARKLEITQPAVSQHLAKLQTHFEAPLFFKKGKKKLVTQQGLKLYDRISEVLLDIENSLRAFQLESKENQSSEIRFGLSKDLLGPVSKNLKYAGPISIVTAPSPDLLGLVKKNTVDLILSDQIRSISNPSLIREVCSGHSFKLVASTHLNLSEELSLAELKTLFEKEGVIINKDYQNFYDKLFLAMKFKDNQLKIKAKFGNWDDLLNYLQSKKTFALIPFSLPVPEGYHMLMAPLEKIFPSKFSIVYKKNAQSIPGFNKFLEELLQTSSEL